MQWSSIKSVVEEEKKLLHTLIDEYKIDLVISDNRFGLNSKKVVCIFITHQLNVVAPFFAAWPNNVNRKHIHNFNNVWVPDYADEQKRLSGSLSDSSKIKIPVEYIGPLSLLEHVAIESPSETKDYLILLSGIEPQRSLVEARLIEQFDRPDKKTVLVRGTKKGPALNCRHIEVIDFIAGAELKKRILSADTVVCRSGYSSLMDLHLLGKKKLILIPTPGQTEQEYLARLWQDKFGAVNLHQNKIREFVF